MSAIPRWASDQGFTSYTISSPPQNLTNCSCRTFLGSIAQMKGLESRLVIYLNPVSGVSGGEMEASRPGLLARAASRVAGSRAAAEQASIRMIQLSI